MSMHETFSKEEKLLRRALDECLEEDLSFVPSEREIARSHRFSQEFERSMRELMEHRSGGRRFFSADMGSWAACILIFFLCAGLFCHMAGLPFSVGSAATEEAADAGAGAVQEELAMEPAESGTESAPSALDSGVGASPDLQRVYCGQSVRLARRQELPLSLDYATTLVNCPVQDEAAPVLFLTIGNIGDADIRYRNRYSLEVWLDGAWYVIPPKDETEGEWLTLAAGMAVDEPIDLSGYQIDHGAKRYRLVAYINADMVSAEFAFEDVFQEKMEKLEGEEGSREQEEL